MYETSYKERGVVIRRKNADTLAGMRNGIVGVLALLLG
jgi:hypothetical protein